MDGTRDGLEAVDRLADSSDAAIVTTPPNHLLTKDVAESLNRGLLEAMPGGVVHIRADGTIAAANPAAQSVFGMSYDELVDRYVAEFEPESFLEDGSPCKAEDYPAVRAMLTGQAQPAMTMGFRRPDGVTVWGIVRATPVHDESGNVAGALVTFLDITERKRAEEDARYTQDLLRRAQSLAKVGCWDWQPDSGKVAWTDEMHVIFDISKDEFGGDFEAAMSSVHPEDLDMVIDRSRRIVVEGMRVPMEYRVVRPDGSIRFVWGVGEPLRDETGAVKRVVGALQDITDRRELEEQLRHMQRMESIGQLAGGIAHDFNNLLQVITGNTALVIGDNPPKPELVQVLKAADRASQLTKQLLAFGRRQAFTPQALNPNDLVVEVQRMLGRTLASNVTIQVTPAEDIESINGDANQLAQVLMNLCLNARDAMPGGGTVVVTTRSVTNDHSFRANRLWARAERYVEIAVRDSGSGMTPEVKARAFEPFYTTKSVGEGIGLGLAVVYGIVQQHGGMVELESEEGRGSTFHVYLPATSSSANVQALDERPDATTGSETILVVEDEPMVRELTKRILLKAGYDVLDAASGIQAIELFEQHQERISLVLTDIVMPGMNGQELGSRLLGMSPDTRIAYTTGHVSEGLQESIGTSALIRKPYTPAQLLECVREALDR